MRRKEKIAVLTGGIQMRRKEKIAVLPSRTFTLIELLVVIAMIAILLRSKWLFFCYFLLFLRFRFLMRKRLTLKYRM